MLLVEEGFDVVSIDASDKMLKYALRERWAHRKEPGFDTWSKIYFVLYFFFCFTSNLANSRRFVIMPFIKRKQIVIGFLLLFFSSSVFFCSWFYFLESWHLLAPNFILKCTLYHHLERIFSYRRGQLAYAV